MDTVVLPRNRFHLEFSRELIETSAKDFPANILHVRLSFNIINDLKPRNT